MNIHEYLCMCIHDHIHACVHKHVHDHAALHPIAPINFDSFQLLTLHSAWLLYEVQKHNLQIQCPL